jgi:hypothetical protein
MKINATSISTCQQPLPGGQLPGIGIEVTEGAVGSFRQGNWTLGIL